MKQFCTCPSVNQSCLDVACFCIKLEVYFLNNTINSVVDWHVHVFCQLGYSKKPSKSQVNAHKADLLQYRRSTQENLDTLSLQCSDRLSQAKGFSTSSLSTRCRVALSCTVSSSVQLGESRLRPGTLPLWGSSRGSLSGTRGDPVCQPSSRVGRESHRAMGLSHAMFLPCMVSQHCFDWNHSKVICYWLEAVLPSFCLDVKVCLLITKQRCNFFLPLCTLIGTEWSKQIMFFEISFLS